MDDERQIRRYRDHLVTIGSGMILISLWNVIDIGGVIFSETRKEILHDLGEFEPWMAMMVLFFWFLVFSVAVFLWGFYIGTQAIAEGMNRKHGSLYLVMAFINSLVYVSGVWHISDGLREADSMQEYIYAIGKSLIAIAGLYIFFQLIYSAIRIRLLLRDSEE